MQTQGLQKPDSHAMEFVPYGQQDRIKLSIKIIQNLVAVKTRTGKTCSDQDAIKFMMMCQARRLNPFEGDAYLVGFDTKNGPVFQLITSHQAYTKRAELHPEFAGLESGVSVETGEGEIKDLDGEIVPTGLKLVGGWARVHLKNRKPLYRRIPISRFRQQVDRHNEYGGTWRDDPGGMIVKCAESDALRSSFPTLLGGMYMRDEKPKIDAATPIDQLLAGGSPEPLQLEAKGPVEELAILLESNSVDFDTFKRWAIEANKLTNPDNVNSIGELTDDDAVKVLKYRKTMLEQILASRK